MSYNLFDVIRLGNYWKDSCLLGKPLGTLDFYQMHTYADSVNVWQTNAPFKVTSASAYALDKPIVISEFSAECSAYETIQQLYDRAHTNGFQVLITLLQFNVLKII